MLSLRLVLDTNVVVSAALKPEGLQRAVLLFAITAPAKMYISMSILREYRTVLARPELRIRRGLQRRFLDLLAQRCRLILPKRRLQVATDPADDKFLECADAARADYLVTGNVRHFPAFWKGTKVVTSREFVTVIAPHLG